MRSGSAFPLAELASIFAGSIVKLLEGIVLGEEADFDLVTGDIEEGGVREENLTEDVGRKMIKTGTGEMDEGERDREERDSNRVRVGHMEGMRGRGGEQRGRLGVGGGYRAGRREGCPGRKMEAEGKARWCKSRTWS